VVVSVLLSMVLVSVLTYFFTVVFSTLNVFGNFDGEGKYVRRGGEVPKILDTNVIIDGRIADIVATGFIEGPLIVPESVVKELRYIADSEDEIRRNRGRRGLDVLKTLLQNKQVNVFLVEDDFPGKEFMDVDTRIMELARVLNGFVITNDYNLNKLASLHGVKVLNVNELANSLKPTVLHGELIEVQIVKPGKEKNQGVGYLEDGTMVVVENGEPYIGKRKRIRVTSFLQTSAGKIVFGRVENSHRDG